jgi:uncharacterized membrane protein
VLAAAFLVLPSIDWLTRHDYTLGFLWRDLSADRARVILTSFTASTLTFLVFVLSSLVMVVQIASAQLTPRIMAITFSDAQAKVMTCMLLLSFLLGTAVLGRIEDDHVPLFGVKITVICVIISIILFLRFIPHLGMSLRPISLMKRVADEGQEAVESIYPVAFDTAAAEKPEPIARNLQQKDGRIIRYDGPPGVLMAFGAWALVKAAKDADCTLEFLMQVGNFADRGDPLFRVFPPDRRIEERQLHQMIAIGHERTIEQDPVFAFRIIVDIASRALSPAVNDPTTAALAIDQLERLLRFVGSRQLDPGMLHDAQGRLRLIIPVPDWEDYVSLAVSEIRLYGANSIQVPRRLLAMLEHLIAVLPDARKPALRKERQLLMRAVKREFTDAVERDRVTTGDRQGVGGAAEE